MKCICPMGGNRVCPDDCLIAAWHRLPDDQKTKERRLPIVKALAEQGYTQDAIAMQLGVSQPTIVRDLGSLFTVNKLPPSTSKRGRKGEGRPKGSGKRSGPQPQRHRNTDNLETVAASMVLDHNKSYEQAAKETGVGSVQVIKTAVAREQGRREQITDPVVEPTTLSMTAQQKLDAAIRQYKRKLDLEFDYRVRAELKRHLDEVALPHYTKQIAELERSIRDRKGIMDRITYRKILSCLHPDRVTDPILKKRYEEAFRLFTELEKRVLNEKESPTEFRRQPRTYEELMAARAKKTAENRARAATRRDAKNVAPR